LVGEEWYWGEETCDKRANSDDNNNNDNNDIGLNSVEMQ